MLLLLISRPLCFVACRAITVLCRPDPRRGVSGTRPDAAFERIRTVGPVDRHGQPFWLPVPRYSASRPENALRADGGRRCNRRMGEIIRHVLAVLPAFLLACLAVAALPGPSTALFLHRTVRGGRAAGLAAVAGNEIGVFCWALAAGAGLTGLLRANRWLYLALHIVGAVVLVYLGVSAWRSARRQDDDAEFGAAFARRLPSGRTPAAAFRASLVTIAANPKAAVFAFSFFPQFLPRHGPVFGTTVALASVQLVLDTCYCVGIVLLASRARRRLSRAAIRRRLERVLGATLVALGIDLAAASR